MTGRYARLRAAEQAVRGGVHESLVAGRAMVAAFREHVGAEALPALPEAFAEAFAAFTAALARVEAAERAIAARGSLVDRAPAVRAAGDAALVLERAGRHLLDVGEAVLAAGPLRDDIVRRARALLGRGGGGSADVP